MANPKQCSMRECEKCERVTRMSWKIEGMFYCYNCYREILNKKWQKKQSQNK